MDQWPRRILLVIGSAVMVWLGGCPPATNSGGEPPAAGLLTSSNRAILETARQAYTAAVADEGADAAREELIGRLRVTEGVAAAGLFEDGTTVFIRHTNGQQSALVTRHFNPPAESLPNAKEIARAGLTQSAGAHRTALATAQNASGKAVPQSRKILMLNVLYPLAPWSDTGLDRLEQQLVEAGWDGTDDKVIERKTRTYIPPPPVEGEPTWKAIAGRAATENRPDFTPDDLFELGGYGAIVLVTHGLYGDPAAVTGSDAGTGAFTPLPPPPVTEGPTFKRIGAQKSATAQSSSASGPYLYLMCGPNMDFGQDVDASGAADGGWTYVPPAPPPLEGSPTWKRLAAKVSDERYAQYGQWFDEGKLIVASYTESGWEGRQDLYVRADLLAEQMADLESNSVVYLSAAYGWKAQSVFMDHGAGDLFAWDGDANLWLSIAMGDTCLGRMLGQNASSDIESYRQGTLPLPVAVEPEWKTLRSQDAGGDGGASTFMLYSGANALYLPAWAEVTFLGTPQDTATLHLVLSYADAALGIPAQEFDIPAPGSDPFEIKALVPAETQLEFTALDAGGKELDRGSRTRALAAGLNSIKLTFVPDTYEITFDPNAVEVRFDAGQWGVATLNAVLLAYETDQSGNRIPIPDKTVKFSTTFTSFGEIIATDTATSGDDGTARVVVQSYNSGQVHLTARVEEDGRQGDTYVNFTMNPIPGRTVGEVIRKPDEGWRGQVVYVEWDKVADGTGRGLEVETYWVKGSGFNDTAYYGDSYYEGINPGENGYSEKGNAIRVSLTGGGGSWDPTAPDQASDEEILSSCLGRFAGAVWEISPVFR